MPDRRVKNRQQCCGSAECRLKSKKEAQRKWLAKNPGYFKGRYEISTRPWFDRHPDYLRQYRQRQKSVSPDNAEQEKSLLTEKLIRIMSDKQDKITILFINGLINLVYQARRINKMR